MRASSSEPPCASATWRIPAAAYRIESAQLRAYFFGDPLAAGRAAGQLAAARPPATVFTSNNMVVMLRGKNDGLRTRIRRALTVPEAQGSVAR